MIVRGKVRAESFAATSVHIRIGKGVDKLLQLISGEACLILEHMVVCWPCSPLEYTTRMTWIVFPPSHNIRAFFTLH